MTGPTKKQYGPVVAGSTKKPYGPVVTGPTKKQYGPVVTGPTMLLIKFHPSTLTSCIFLLMLNFSCRPSEEVGVASYFIDNQSDYSLRIAGEFIGSVDVSCDSCEVQPHSTILLGTDAAFGAAPRPEETIKHLRIYKLDTLKLEVHPPYPDSLWMRKKGKNEYDSDFTLSIGNKDVE